MSMISRSWSNIKNFVGSENVKQRGEVLGGILASSASYGDHEALKALAPLVTALCSNNITGVSDVGLYIFYKIKNESGEYQIFFKRLTVA